MSSGVVATIGAARTSWTAEELMASSFPPPRWAVRGIFPEGLSLLAGAPKVGKSWLAIGVAVAVASGTKAIGNVPVDVGDVLYLALEDTPRRLQSRLRKVLAGQAAPGRLTIATACPTIAEGGIEKITAWLDSHPDARLVVIDVFARVRGRAPANASAYDADYAPMVALKQIADRYGVAVLVVHHTRKASSEDFLDTVSGTQGLAGAADAVIVLQRSRGQADAVLHVTGRDVEEAEYALRFDPDQGAWQLLEGPADDYNLGDTRQSILRHLRLVGTATPKQIAEELELAHDVVRQTCSRMARADQLVTDGSGGYRAPLSPVTPVTPVTENALSDQTPYVTQSPSDSSDRCDRADIPTDDCCEVCRQPLDPSVVAEGFSSHAGCAA
jgi:hypothetical protein